MYYETITGHRAGVVPRGSVCKRARMFSETFTGHHALLRGIFFGLLIEFVALAGIYCAWKCVVHWL